jgi:8-oxo-dGTP pyrophosphatase MutT (NUDIX family)
VTDLPEFGTPAARGAVPRCAAYALVRDGRGCFLAVRGPSGLFLPGGGCESEESPEQALVRELREETGRDLVSFAYRSTAIQHFAAADGVSYRMEAVFYTAALGDQVAEPEGGPLWVDPATGEDLWYHACHAWAVRNEAEAAV